ncbi:MAG TPA: hypothetical protein VH682_20785 [Gemmataceae bacterium]|jgi:hypothetical protein
MRRLLLLGLLVLTGCTGLQGPRKRDVNPQRVDPPGMPIPEQQARARDRTAYQEAKPYWVGPRTYQELPEQQWGQPSH